MTESHLRLYEVTAGWLYWHVDEEPEWLAMGDGLALPPAGALPDALAWEDWIHDQHNADRWEPLPAWIADDAACREVASLIDGVWTIARSMGTGGTHYVTGPDPDHVRLLRQRIDESGLSITRWAEDVAWRESRTVERWLAGKSPIPARVTDHLQWPEPHPWP